LLVHLAAVGARHPAGLLGRVARLVAVLPLLPLAEVHRLGRDVFGQLKNNYFIIFFEGCPGCWGANPGSFDFVYFLIPSLNR
jgi:hypothetical protein